MSDDSTATLASLRAGLAADPLWDFALSLYARPGVEAACLLLQDEAGLDVCELLWHAWLYRHGLSLAEAPVALDEVHRWQRQVTLPLRELRRRLKADARARPGVAKVRGEVQRAELAAEREALLRLQQMALEPTTRLDFLPHARLANFLADRYQLQKKSQLLALETLECQLDHLRPAR